jgi:hypothetical protein
MKKLLMLFVFLFLLSGYAWAGEKNLKFAWEQSAGDVQSGNFGGWLLYMAETAGGYDFQNPWDTIVFVSEQSSYEATKVLTSPDGEAHTYYFVITAYDMENNESGPSNEVSQLIDFEAPGVPFTLTVTVITP